jgi:phage-related protein
LFLYKETFKLKGKLKVIERFEVVFIQEAKDFLDSLESKTREKIIYNIRKSRIINDPELFKKLTNEIWEFRTIYNKTYYRLFAFWDKTNQKKTLVVSTHGIVKKTAKVPKTEIERAEILRKKYLLGKYKK